MPAKVTVFTTNHCPSCQSLKKWLEERQVTYETVNLEEHPERQTEIFKKTGALTVPITLIVDKLGQEQVVVGNQYDRLKRFLGLS